MPKAPGLIHHRAPCACIRLREIGTRHIIVQDSTADLTPSHTQGFHVGAFFCDNVGRKPGFRISSFSFRHGSGRNPENSRFGPDGQNGILALRGRLCLIPEFSVTENKKTVRQKRMASVQSSVFGMKEVTLCFCSSSFDVGRSTCPECLTSGWWGILVPCAHEYCCAPILFLCMGGGCSMFVSLLIDHWPLGLGASTLDRWDNQGPAPHGHGRMPLTRGAWG